MYTKPVDSVAKEFNSSVFSGLKTASVPIQKGKFGTNALSPKKQKTFIKRLIEALSEPTLVILEFAWVITVGVNLGKFFKNGTGDFLECVGIMLAVILSASLTLIMEGRSQKAFEALGKVYDKISVKVIRDGVETVVSKEEVVCGDIVIVESGDKIVADGRVIESFSLTVDESTLTGESGRVEKFADRIYPKNTPLAERRNMLYSGSFVGGGKGKMLVTAVGDGAELGKIATELKGDEGQSAPLNQKLARLGKTVTIIGSISAIFVFLLSLARLAIFGEINFFSVQDAFLEGIVLIVAAVPEGLPATAAISLTLNVVKLASSNALIRKLVAAETAGAVSVICSDKTGTLTQNKMCVERVVFQGGQRKNRLMLNALINSTASVKIVGKKEQTFGSATEIALIKYYLKKGENFEKYRDKRLIGRVLPFNSSNKYMITECFGNKNLIFIKGAPEIIINDCSVDKSEKVRLLKEIEKFQSQGKRVIAFSSLPSKIYGEKQALSLSGGKADFDGYAVISDPVRPGVKQSVEICQGAGIKVMMMTGDNLATATAIAEELGLLKGGGKVFSADHIDSLTENELKRVISQVKVVARSTPTTKLKIVNALQNRGEVVAVTGDGVNDAPAIRRADLGVSMGSGSEITKEASDVVLLDDSFSTIVKAVSFGRNVYRNFQRFITFQLTVNLTAMIVVIASLILGLESPFTSVQLLWIDIIMDGPPALTLAMEADRGQFMKDMPVKRTDGIITPKMLFKIILQGAFMALVVVMEYLYDFIGAGLGSTKTAVFCIFVIFQLFNAFNCRKTGRDSVFSGFADNKPMLLVFGATFLLQIVITQVLCGFFATRPLSIQTWLKIIGVCSLTVVFSECYKLAYRLIIKGKKGKTSAENTSFGRGMSAR